MSSARKGFPARNRWRRLHSVDRGFDRAVGGHHDEADLHSRASRRGEIPVRLTR
jgi:hypothetical protein